MLSILEEVLKSIKVNPQSVAIVGWEEGGAGQISAWLESSSDYKISCFVNPVSNIKSINVDKENAKRDSRLFEYPLKKTFKNKPLITSENWIDILKDIGIKKVLVTTSDNIERNNLITEARISGLELINAIHPTATIMDDAILHDNIMIHARAFIGYRSEIHSGSLINNNSFLDHHNVVYSSAQLAPGVVTAGNVTIGKCSYIWTGAVIINMVRIGEQSIIGAGSVVLKDVPPFKTMVGVPGEIILE